MGVGAVLEAEGLGGLGFESGAECLGIVYQCVSAKSSFVVDDSLRKQSGGHPSSCFAFTVWP